MLLLRPGLCINSNGWVLLLCASTQTPILLHFSVCGLPFKKNNHAMSHLSLNWDNKVSHRHFKCKLSSHSSTRCVQNKYLISKRVCRVDRCPLPEKVGWYAGAADTDRLINIFLKWLHLPRKDFTQSCIHKLQTATNCSLKRQSRGNTTKEPKRSIVINCTGIKRIAYTFSFTQGWRYDRDTMWAPTWYELHLCRKSWTPLTACCGCTLWTNHKLTDTIWDTERSAILNS